MQHVQKTLCNFNGNLFNIYYGLNGDDHKRRNFCAPWQIAELCLYFPRRWRSKYKNTKAGRGYSKYPAKSSACKAGEQLFPMERLQRRRKPYTERQLYAAYIHGRCAASTVSLYSGGYKPCNNVASDKLRKAS